ncbi:MAG: hypothetical protein RIC14_08715 [Filomicrobium sp.]
MGLELDWSAIELAGNVKVPEDVRQSILLLMNEYSSTLERDKSTLRLTFREVNVALRRLANNVKKSKVQLVASGFEPLRITGTDSHLYVFGAFDVDPADHVALQLALDRWSRQHCEYRPHARPDDLQQLSEFCWDLPNYSAAKINAALARLKVDLIDPEYAARFRMLQKGLFKLDFHYFLLLGPADKDALEQSAIRIAEQRFRSSDAVSSPTLEEIQPCDLVDFCQPVTNQQKRSAPHDPASFLYFKLAHLYELCGGDAKTHYDPMREPVGDDDPSPRTHEFTRFVFAIQKHLPADRRFAPTLDALANALAHHVLMWKNNIYK